MKQTLGDKIHYWWYKFRCWIFGHNFSCCNEITKRCSQCPFVKGRSKYF